MLALDSPGFRPQPSPTSGRSEKGYRYSIVIESWRNEAHPVMRGKVASYLVDPASSHMLVSKIKPCMSKYIPLTWSKPRMAH